jgi:predicted CXXCH cytochrome family protein
VSKKRRSRTRAHKPDTRTSNATPAVRRRMPVLAMLLLIAAGAALFGLWWTSRTPVYPVASVTQQTAAPPTEESAHYVGRAACAGCHADEYRLWRGSHHDLAMQEANDATVLGDFADRTFTYQDITSRFFQKDNTFFVNTDGPDGKLADYPIKYTFGVWPLQQYLVEFPGGRLQALSLAWDARAAEQGGQRWFHLYPDERIDHEDPLHWTGLYQNWNLQCAACHSTNLRKGYDEASNSYETSFSELNVSCEACHGPGSRHADWASEAKAPYRADDDKGLAVTLHSRWDAAWKFPEAGAVIAQRDEAADATVMNDCAACHARRSTLTETVTPGAPLQDSHRLAMPTPPLYYADGQQRDEVYVWGSFLQSRMFQKGVTCLDCHEPHTAELRVQGNALCARCHDASRFDSLEHHFHEPGTPGAQCVECHMPAQNYMVVDARRDHSIRLPRPDLSETLGSPNACTQCHADRKSGWAAAAMDEWYSEGWRERAHYGTTLHAGETQGVSAVPGLLRLAQETSMPALVRAAAATLLQPYMRQDLLMTARSLLQDADPELRIAALRLIEPADPVNRLLAAGSLLEDPVRGVRIEAARILADVPDEEFTQIRRRARASALNEYLAALKQNADWPAENVTLGNLYLRQGNAAKAIEAYERALALDVQFAGAYVNLADVYRMQSQDDVGEQVLRRGLAQLPQVADLHHALGLLLVRKGDTAAAVTELELAAQLAPDSVRYTYVYAVALHSTGQVSKALTVLRETDVRHPNTPDILGALVSMYREVGDNPAALEYARKLAAALPEDRAVQRLLTELEASM